jgi:serine/threonine protein phosphatase PrpC
MSATPAVEIAFRTDPGRDPDKQVNEDAATHVETRLGLLAIVCDGMGGHAGGKEASELAVKTIVECVQNASGSTAAHALKVAIEEANRRVVAMSTAESGLRPGSTVVAMIAHEGGAEVAHVGDSRMYLVHAGAISQVTKDHSMVQEMVDRNIIRAEDAATHPDANKIMRALGITGDVDVDLRAEPIAFVAGDVFVLCSDGLSDLVGPADILQVAGSHPPAQAASQLVDLANARGGHDNVTAMVIRMKTTAIVSSDAKPTLVKTVQVTQATMESPGPQRAEKPAGPVKTILASPAPGAAAPAPLPPAQPQTIALPPLQAPATVPPASRSDGRGKAALVVAIIAGLLAVGIAAVLIWTTHHQGRVSVPIIDGAAAPATAPPVEEDAAALAPAVTPAPTLLPEPAICAKARAARDRNSPAAPRLEAACRAQGGSIASASASAAPPPAPTPTIPPTPVTEPLVCTEARAARAKNLPNAGQLEATCRAAGGTP